MLKVIKDSAPSIRKRSIMVETPYSKDDLELVFNMHNYIKYSQDPKNDVRSGVGLAAPQVGINKRMLAIHYQKDEETLISYALINPKVIATSVKMCCLEVGEGCLSVDNDIEGYVYRPFKITIEAYDALQKANIKIVAKGYDAIVLQHELDHLDGILYYDRIDKKNPYKEVENSIKI